MSTVKVDNLQARSDDVLTIPSSLNVTGYSANVSGNVSVARSLAVGYTDGRTPQANLEVTGNVVMSSMSYPNAGGLWSGRNMAINGAMQVAQRGTSFTSVTASGTFGVDRFLYHLASAGTWTVTQSTDVPTGQGFLKALRVDCTSTQASLAAGAYARIDHRLLGQDLIRLKKGTANAEKFTVSFWVKSNKTGTYVMEIDDDDNSRCICQLYTVDTTNTWEKKVLTFDGDTSGALGDDANRSWTIEWWFASGTDWKGGTLQTTWASKVNNTRTTGMTNNLADSTDNDFAITGVQFEVGEYATPFEFEPYQTTYEKCLKYYYKWESSTTYAKVGVGRAWDTSNFAAALDLPVAMRASPTLAYSALGDFAVAGIGGTPSAITQDQRTTDFRSIGLNITQGSTPFTTGTIYQLEADNNAGSELEFNAEI